MLQHPKKYLDKHRFDKFIKLTTGVKPCLTTLPPTKGSAQQHSHRVRLQLQKWLGSGYRLLGVGRCVPMDSNPRAYCPSCNPNNNILWLYKRVWNLVWKPKGGNPLLNSSVRKLPESVCTNPVACRQRCNERGRLCRLHLHGPLH